MMPLAWTALDRLLEGKILLAAEQEQIAYRRGVVGTMQHGVGGDLHAARHGDRLGREPAAAVMARCNSRLVADKHDVDRIAGMPVAGLRAAIETRRNRGGLRKYIAQSFGTMM